MIVSLAIFWLFFASYLLPNRTKSKTMVVNNSHDPIWEEEFVFSSVSLENLTKERVLEVTIWDYNHGSSNDFLGGVRLGPLPSQSSRKKDWMDCSGEEVHSVCVCSCLRHNYLL